MKMSSNRSGSDCLAAAAISRCNNMMIKTVSRYAPPTRPTVNNGSGNSGRYHKQKKALSEITEHIDKEHGCDRYKMTTTGGAVGKQQHPQAVNEK